MCLYVGVLICEGRDETKACVEEEAYETDESTLFRKPAGKRKRARKSIEKKQAMLRSVVFVHTLRLVFASFLHSCNRNQYFQSICHFVARLTLALTVSLPLGKWGLPSPTASAQGFSKKSPQPQPLNVK